MLEVILLVLRHIVLSFESDSCNSINVISIVSENGLKLSYTENVNIITFINNILYGLRCYSHSELPQDVS